MADPDAAPPAPPAEPAPPAPWRGRWRLTGSKINCRSSPSAADPSNIICKLRQGAVVVVEELQASDWCLLKGPPPVAGRFVRLRMSDTAERCWEFLGPEDEDVSPGELWQAVQQFPHTSSAAWRSLWQIGCGAAGSPPPPRVLTRPLGASKGTQTRAMYVAGVGSQALES
ncbi:unnamed protein product [Effrenium voratum]|nr:unnamed protein product [Effrenium voratum]